MVIDSKSPREAHPSLLGPSYGFLSQETRPRACYCLFEEFQVPVSHLNMRAVETCMTELGHHVLFQVRPASLRALLSASFSFRETPAVRLDSERVDAC
jgi:hypothetical protein